MELEPPSMAYKIMDAEEHENEGLYFKTPMSACYWYPILRDLDVPTPETKLIQFDAGYDEEEGMPFPKWDTDEVIDAIEDLGGAPAFIRTDHESDKHHMKSASKVPSTEPDIVDDHIWELIRYNNTSGLVGRPFSTLMIREWLDLEHNYTAFDGTPIAKELRYFVEDGKIDCVHFYWPEDSIKAKPGTELPDDWKEHHSDLVDEAIADSVAQPLRGYAETVAEAFEDKGAWSVDFAQATDGTWYAIDMAPADVSDHPDSIRADEGDDV